ncbi:hypothetical protein GCM10010510_25140 [Streptomyces anandii JCM 4720]|nr:hypothetical protein GCM10010510_25140 [Streptomyces anandii JCM 4720]
MVYAEPMARHTVAPAVRELMERRSTGHQLNNTVTLGGDDFTLCAHVRVRWLTDDQAKVSLACWAVNTDTARYLGGHPPSDDEFRLRPYGTATPDEGFTSRVADHLAICMRALDSPQPDDDGHLAITVPWLPPELPGNETGAER